MLNAMTDLFVVEEESFEDLIINPTPEGTFYYFFNNRKNRLVKHFLLGDKDTVYCTCQVTLIKKEERFTPRISVAIRNKRTGKIATEIISNIEENRTIKASVNLDDCHDNFWKLIDFLQKLRRKDIPEGSLSLVSQDEAEIVSALRGRDSESIVSIIKGLSVSQGISLSQSDINQLLQRRERLTEFEIALPNHSTNEEWWQNFFEQNKWIFGYGLNYQILRQEQAQPHYGGTRVEGTGGQRGDMLAATDGDASFTVLVEIKTPATQLLQGTSEVRNGAWSLSKNLTDAVSQISANIETWQSRGATTPENRDRLENNGIFTVQPKGIIVIGRLNEISTERNKRESFQRFRKLVHGIDILTFDELFERAKYIVASEE
jgi:hypothetical protein